MDSVWSAEMEPSCLTSSVLYLVLDLIFVSLAVARGGYNSLEGLPTEKKRISDNLTVLVCTCSPQKPSGQKAVNCSYQLSTLGQ